MSSPSDAGSELVADYYSCHDVDHLRHDDVNAAVEDELDGLEIKHWPAELVVMGYVEADDDYVDDPPAAGEQYYVHNEEYDVTVNVATWVKTHAQHWAKEPEVAAWLRSREEEASEEGT